MQFIMMSKANKDSEAGRPPDPRLIEAVGKLMEETAKAGQLVGAGGLMPSSAGAKLRMSNGKITVLDGPFAEAKEVVGGYAIVELASKEEAIEMGRRFLEMHAEILGPDYEGESEIRQMYT